MFLQSADMFLQNADMFLQNAGGMCLHVGECADGLWEPEDDPEDACDQEADGQIFVPLNVTLHFEQTLDHEHVQHHGYDG